MGNLLGQRPYSIRTRIKTLSVTSPWLSRERQRPYSIRTRIKTQRVGKRSPSETSVRDHIPLEQGLRLTLVRSSSSSTVAVRDHIPLEQGLRQSVRQSATRLMTYVRDHIPLEQGLRLVEIFTSDVRLTSETIFH